MRFFGVVDPVLKSVTFSSLNLENELKNESPNTAMNQEYLKQPLAIVYGIFEISIIEVSKTIPLRKLPGEIPTPKKRNRKRGYLL